MWVRNTGALVQGHLVSWGVRIREGFPEEAIQLRSEVTKRDRELGERVLWEWSTLPHLGGGRI